MLGEKSNYGPESSFSYMGSETSKFEMAVVPNIFASSGYTFIVDLAKISCFEYLIRINFRTDKFSRIFAQKLNLREIVRKLVPNFRCFLLVSENLSARNFFNFIFWKSLVARKFVRAKIYTNKVYELGKPEEVLRIPIQKFSRGQIFAQDLDLRRCVKIISTEILKFCFRCVKICPRENFQA